MRAVVIRGKQGMEPGAAGTGSATQLDQRVEQASTVSGLALLVALAAAAFAKGAFSSSVQLFIVALLAIAVLVALSARLLPVTDLRGAVVIAGALLAVWAVLRATAAGTPASGLGWVLLGAGTVAVVLVSRRLSAASRAMLPDGLLAVGVVVALAGLLGVALHLRPWGLPSQGLWRAASTLTYANATAGLLVPLALLALARLTATPRSVYVSLAAMCLLTSVAATLSRAGLAALAAGLLVLCWLLGVRRVARVGAGPAAGAGVALLGLLPSLRAAAPAQPGYAATAMALGVMLVVLVQRSAGRKLALPVAGVAVVSALLVIFLAPQFHHPIQALTAHRLTLASSSRSGEATAALRIVASHPLAGVGPGHATLRWTSAGGTVNVDEYAHDEYLQVLTDLGVAGAALAGLLLAGTGRLLWQARTASPDRALWAGAVAGATAFALHSGFDFLWQVPAIPLTVAAIVGLAVCPPPDHRHEPLGKPSEEKRSRKCNAVPKLKRAWPGSRSQAAPPPQPFLSRQGQPWDSLRHRCSCKFV